MTSAPATDDMTQGAGEDDMTQESGDMAEIAIPAQLRDVLAAGGDCV